MASVTYRKIQRDNVTARELSLNSFDQRVKSGKPKKMSKKFSAKKNPSSLGTVSTTKSMESSVFRRFEVYHQGADLPLADKPLLHDSKQSEWKPRILRYDPETDSLTMFSSQLTVNPVWKCHVNQLVSYRAMSDTIVEEQQYLARSKLSADITLGERLKLFAVNSVAQVKYGSIKSNIIVIRVSCADGYEELFLACQEQRDLDQWACLFDKVLSQRWLSHIRDSMRISARNVESYIMRSSVSSDETAYSIASVSLIEPAEPKPVVFKRPKSAARRKPSPVKIQTLELTPISVMSQLSQASTVSSPSPYLDRSPLFNSRFSSRISKSSVNFRRLMRKSSLTPIAEHPEMESSLSVIEAYSKIETKEPESVSNKKPNHKVMKYVDNALLNLCESNNQAHFMLSVLQINREIQESITIWREEIAVKSDLIKGHSSVTALVSSCAKTLNDIMMAYKGQVSFHGEIFPKIVDIRSKMGEVLVTVGKYNDLIRNDGSVYEYSESIVKHLVGLRQSFETLRTSYQSINSSI